MNRRAFLALIGSAPLACLTPWPHILQRQTIVSNAMAPTALFVTSGESGYVFTVMAGHLYAYNGITLKPIGELMDLQARDTAHSPAEGAAGPSSHRIAGRLSKTRRPRAVL